jgi:hypothetical protein
MIVGWQDPSSSWGHLHEPDDWNDLDFVRLLDKCVQSKMEGGSRDTASEHTVAESETEQVNNTIEEKEGHDQELSSDSSETLEKEEVKDQATPMESDASLCDHNRSNDIIIPTLKDDLLAIVGQQGNLLEIIKNNYKDDKFFSSVLENPKNYRNFTLIEGLLHIHDCGRRLLCIPSKVMYKGRRLCEIVISEAHSLLAHLGASKTIVYLKDHIWWPGMVQEVKHFYESCETCARSKPSTQKPYRLLNPLDVPMYPWESVGIDFIGPLPESKDRDSTYNAITVIIDLLTAMVHLVPSRINYTASQVAELIFLEVYKHHGLPCNIVSD